MLSTSRKNNQAKIILFIYVLYALCTKTLFPYLLASRANKKVLDKVSKGCVVLGRNSLLKAYF